MEIRELSLQEMEKLYGERMEADFPPEELRPFSSIRELTGEGKYKSFGCFEEGLGAYGTFAFLPGRSGVLLDYFAVDAGAGGRGSAPGGCVCWGRRQGALARAFCLLRWNAWSLPKPRPR